MKLSIKTFLVTCLMTGAAAYVSAMDVHVQDAPIRTVLTGLAQSSGLNVIVDDTVEGTVSIELTGVTATEAMECIAESQNLLYNRKGNVIIITAGRSYDNAKRAYTWKLKHADTETVKKAAEAVVSEGQVKAHGDTNSLVFGGSVQDAAAVDRIVQELDVVPRQVDVSVEIVSLNKEAMKELGIQWNWSSVSGGPGHTEQFAYGATVHAMINEGKANILARPHLMALNGKEAQILIGDRIPVLTEHLSNGETTTTTDYEDAGIKLNYTPRIHDDGSVTAHIKAEVSMPQLVPELKAYRIMTRRAETEVHMDNDEALILGGLISREEIDNLRKVPLLGILPVLGRLFRYHYKSNKETELVIIIRSHVVS